MVYRSSRGAISAWRQGGDAFVAATTKPRREGQIRTRGTNARIGHNLAVESTAGSFSAAGVATVAFAGTGIRAGGIAAPGAASVGFSGSSIATGSVLAAGTSTAAFNGGDGSNVVPSTGSSTVSFSGSSIAAGSMLAAGGSAVGFIGEAVEEGGGGTVDPAAVWNYTLSNGKTAQQTLVELHTMLTDLHRIHGLQADAPLVVDRTERTAGDIVQTISQAGEVVTVTRVN